MPHVMGSIYHLIHRHHPSPPYCIVSTGPQTPANHETKATHITLQTLKDVLHSQFKSLASVTNHSHPSLLPTLNRHPTKKEDVPRRLLLLVTQTTLHRALHPPSSKHGRRGQALITCLP
nr:hypothetical protein Iba_scaffold16392CG0330 [Ipomoea batatas]